MKKLVSLLVIITLGISLVFMSSCKKAADELVGTWDVMTFDTAPVGTLQITFDGNSTAVRILNTESGMQVDSCYYEITKKSLKEHIIFRDSKMLTGLDKLDGIYRIDKIKNDVIVATRTEFEDSDRSGAYYRLELKRKN